MRVLRVSKRAQEVVPVACALSTSKANTQIAAWQDFNDDYLLDVDSAPEAVTTHYAKVDDAITRLEQFVAVERVCCSIVIWSIDSSHSDLRLTVSGADGALAELTFLNELPIPYVKESL